MGDILALVHERQGRLWLTALPSTWKLCMRGDLRSCLGSALNGAARGDGERLWQADSAGAIVGLLSANSERAFWRKIRFRCRITASFTRRMGAATRGLLIAGSHLFSCWRVPARKQRTLMLRRPAINLQRGASSIWG